MTRKTRIAYGLLLSLVALLLSFQLAPGQTYARYHTAVCWNTVVCPEADPMVTLPDTPILTARENTLTVTLSDAVTDPVCTFEMLSADQDFLACTAGNLTAVCSGSTVTVKLGAPLPPAGTYRLVLAWENKETAVTESTAVTFFINYSGV